MIPEFDVGIEINYDRQAEGPLYVYAWTATAVHELECAIRGRRADFDRLAAQTWAEGLRAAFTRLDDQ